ncbi:MAG: hypothetical protein JW941_06420 [Candidatus Coatesbacteria bacterium]|nr:hypothetical protein [Candidatus Coatesbacteria bacterium]
MPRLVFLLLAVILVSSLGWPIIAIGQIVYPVPGEEVWEVVSETGCSRHWASDRCCAFDGRNRLYVCNTGVSDDYVTNLRRWDGESWQNIDHSEPIWSLCAGQENAIIIGEEMNLGYIRDDEYHEIQMTCANSERQFTTCLDDDQWVLSYGPDDGLQRTNWLHGGGDWLPIPGYTLLSEVDTWRGGSRWACSDGRLYWWDLLGGVEWTPQEPRSGQNHAIIQVEPYGAEALWANGSGYLLSLEGDNFINMAEEGYPEPNAPIARLAIDKELCPWCLLENNQVARWRRLTNEWIHYTCEALSGVPQDIFLDHFDNPYIITDEMIVKMAFEADGIEIDFQCKKQTYAPGETVGINTIAKNASWVGMLTDIYIAFWNKNTGEWLFLPNHSAEATPLIARFWAKRRAPIYMGALDIGPAPMIPGDYLVLIGFMFEGRFDKLSSNVDTYDITVMNSSH